MDSTQKAYRYFRYVVHDRLLLYKALGWHWVADLGDRAGQYACLMEWKGDGEPKEPPKD